MNRRAFLKAIIAQAPAAVVAAMVGPARLVGPVAYVVGVDHGDGPDWTAIQRIIIDGQVRVLGIQYSFGPAVDKQVAIANAIIDTALKVTWAIKGEEGP